MYLTVELVPGTDIEQAAKDMIALAVKLDVGVKADFNGIDIHAAKNGSASLLINNYHKAVNGDGPLSKMAFSN